MTDFSPGSTATLGGISVTGGPGTSGALRPADRARAADPRLREAARAARGDRPAESARLIGTVAIDLDEAAPGTRGADGGRTRSATVTIPDLAPDETAYVVVERAGGYHWVRPEPDAANRFVLTATGDEGSRGVLGAAGKWIVTAVAGKAIGKVARKVTETAVARRERNRHMMPLQRFDLRGHAAETPEPADLSQIAAGPSLLFLHGTFSSPRGGFGAVDPDLLRALESRYAGRVWAYDHATVSRSPAENAEDLIGLLRDAGGVYPVDIISHSRGGLVARELAARSADAPIEVRQTLFVATPNAGTPLAAAGRLGDLIDMLSTVLGLVPENGVTETVELVLSVLSHIWEGAQRALPGLTAMDPGGEYLATLNARGEDTGAVLRAAAANFEPVEGDDQRTRLRDFATDALFGAAQNDLVVPTLGVFDRLEARGFPITDRIVLDEHQGIDHSGFWRSDAFDRRVAEWFGSGAAGRDGADPREHRSAPARVGTDGAPLVEVRRALEEGDVRAAITAVESLDDAAHAELESAVNGPIARGMRGVGGEEAAGRVVVVPGLTGSMLRADGDLVWFDPVKVVFGRLASLAVGSGATVSAAGLHISYLPLLERLSRAWQPVPLAYDWRLPLTESAAVLNERLRAMRRRSAADPIHIVAHSMGGVIVRAACADDPRLWDRVLRDGRVVMLGTPNRGAVSAAMTLAGEERSVRLLALADLKHDVADVQALIRSFPSLYDLLPSPFAPERGDDAARLFSAASWGELAGIARRQLSRARAFHQALAENEALIGTDPFWFIAGHGYPTPVSIRSDAATGFTVGTTIAGDGRVAHVEGPRAGPDPTRTRYSLTRHGDLPSDPAVLDAVVAILADGAESSLPSEPPPLPESDRVEGVRALATIRDVSPLPRGTEALTHRARDGDARAAAALAEHATADLLGTVAPDSGTAPAIQVTVAHGSLEMASAPVIVGHYRGVPIAGAEQFLDAKIGGALRDRQISRVYPEIAGEAVLVRSRTARPPGALVICLGDFGELTSAILTRGARDAALRWALAEAPATPGRDGPLLVEIASVLVGTYGRYGLSVPVALTAIVEGVIRAGIELEESGLADRVQIGALTFIEYYEQKAEDATVALRDVVRRLPADVAEAASLDITRDLVHIEGGRPGAPKSYDDDAWPRLLVYLEDENEVDCAETSEDSDPDDGAPERLATLRFTLLGGAARADERGHTIEPCDIERLISMAVTERRPDAQINNTLYELLFPNDLKDTLATMENVWLVVDEPTADFPWEMLAGRDPRGTPQPLALRVGFLRQLKTDDRIAVRVSPRRPIGRHALVVGDPPTDFARLPGARHEAEEVADLLARVGDYTVEPGLIFGPDDDPEDVHSLRIRNALYAHEYRIVHIAAHGVVTPGDRSRTGVLVGRGQYLTPLAFRQMPVVPELVFLNCCHLGRMEGAARPDTNFAALAASVSAQLMREGVKAVVAAGWAVDDRAAEEFARAFYGRMLSGDNFGEAVSAARKAAHAADRRSNTWGAYQCYGDPSFVLETSGGGAGAPEDPVSRAELVDLLRTAEVQAGTARTDADLEWVARRVAERYEPILAGDAPTRPDWAKADALSQLAATHQKLGDYRRAVVHYRDAIAREDALIDVRHVEQLINCEVRLATRWHREGRPGAEQIPEAERFEETTPHALIERAKERLDLLKALSDPPTAERCALEGGLFKKWAVVTEPDAAVRLERLRRSRDAYVAALERLPGQVYHRTLAAQLELLHAEAAGDRRALGRAGRDPYGIRRLYEDHRARIDAERVSETNFWDRAALGDLLLTLVLMDPAGAETDGLLEEMVASYRPAFELRSTAFERATVVDHIEDVHALSPARGAGLGEVLAALRGIG